MTKKECKILRNFGSELQQANHHLILAVKDLSKLGDSFKKTAQEIKTTIGDLSICHQIIFGSDDYEREIED